MVIVYYQKLMVVPTTLELKINTHLGLPQECKVRDIKINGTHFKNTE